MADVLPLAQLNPPRCHVRFLAVHFFLSGPDGLLAGFEVFFAGTELCLAGADFFFTATGELPRGDGGAGVLHCGGWANFLACSFDLDGVGWVVGYLSCVEMGKSAAKYQLWGSWRMLARLIILTCTGVQVCCSDRCGAKRSTSTTAGRPRRWDLPARSLV